MTKQALLKELKEHVQVVGSLRDAAQGLGVSVSYLCDVLNGRREPGPKLLEAWGVERTVSRQVSYKRREK